MIWKMLLVLGLPSLAVSATVSISAKYRAAANVFVIMDCVSGWWDKSFCLDEGAYQKEWSARFGLNDIEISHFKQYDVIRQKYYRGLGAPKEDTGPFSDGIFAKRSGIKEDLIAPAFYSSESIPEALSKLKSTVSEGDLKYLKEFYDFFKPKYERLLAES
jgi:hypothetical protein